MQNYVLGFVFNESKKEVLMVSKTKGPQAYKLNGVGGHIEEGEQPLTAMTRECMEETGLFIPEAQWKYRADIDGDDYKVFVFSAFTDSVYLAKAIEKVEVHIISTSAIEHDNGFYQEGDKYTLMDNVKDLMPIVKVEDLTQVVS